MSSPVKVMVELRCYIGGLRTGGDMSTNQITETDVLEKLRVVQDPDLHRDIVSLGFVKNKNAVNIFLIVIL